MIPIIARMIRIVSMMNTARCLATHPLKPSSLLSGFGGFGPGGTGGGFGFGSQAPRT
jgi:hypothetical protein